MGRACVSLGDKGNTKAFSWGNLKERDHLEDLGVDLRIILKRILDGMGGWTGFI
jgi:hypothetical protein